MLALFAPPAPMKKLLLLSIFIALVAGLAWWWQAGKEAGPAAGAKGGRPPAAVPVNVAKVERRDMPVVLEAVGRAEAYASVTLKSRVDGQVAEVPFAEGQHVGAGDVLVRLDPADFDARLLAAQANVAKSQAQLAKAHIDVERYAALRDKGFVSVEKVSDMRTSEAASAAQLAADTAALELARLQLGYATIRAPFAGIVGARLVFPGSAIKTNETAVAVVNRVQPIYASFTLAEKHLAQVRAALRARALAVSVGVAGSAGGAGEARPETGELRFIDNAVDAATGTIQLKALLANADERLTPGQFATVELVIATRKDALVIPAPALQQGPGGNLVFVVGAEGQAQPRKVTLDFVRAGRAVIATGLAEGETVVTDGQLRLTPGAKVEVKVPAAPTAPLPPAAATAKR